MTQDAYQESLKPISGAMNDMLQAILGYLEIVSQDPNISDINRATSFIFVAGLLSEAASGIMVSAKLQPGFEAAKEALEKQALSEVN